MNTFDTKITENIGGLLEKSDIEILQINLGKLCNLSCSHCHVEAGPTKKEENMDQKTSEAVIRLMDYPGLTTVDITGGAPELNPHFKNLVLEARKRNLHVIDRCNLTVFFEEGMDSLPEFLAENQVEVVASLPCYSKDNVDKQRGKGTFNGSIEALLWLNRLGYGKDGSNLKLNLVYNPVGPHLPPSQVSLEKDYKERLKEDFNIEFNNLYTITNMAIKRYAKYLKAFNQLEDYERLLVDSFNPETIVDLMCKNTVSVSWDGKLYDCDFNQMLDMQMKNGNLLTVFNVSLDSLKDFRVLTAKHCFGCTAGSGSSCQGALT